MVAILIGLAGILGLFATTLLGPVATLLPLRSKASTVEIAFPTSELQGARFWLVFIQLILSSLIRRVGPSATAYTRVGTNSASTTTLIASEDTHIVPGPTLSLSMPFRVTPSSLSQYSKCLSAGFSRSSILSNKLHLHLLLSALTEPAMLLLLATRACPIDPVGSVNVRNRFEIPHLSELRSYLERGISKSGAEQGTVRATLASGVKQVKRGYEHRIKVDLVARDKVLYTQIFTMLVFARRRESVPAQAQSASHEKMHAFGEVQLSTEDPKDWAELSKDWNPIHWVKWTARGMGFRGLIAHGNHVAARAVEVSQAGQDQEGESSWMEVEFKRPVILPATLQVFGGEAHLEAREGDKVDVALSWG